MADFNYREWADARKASGGQMNYNVPTPGSQALSWADFNNKYNQVAAANQLLQNGEIDGTLNRGKNFRMNGGTDGLYSGYRDASLLENFGIAMGNIGRFFNNLPGEIAGAIGGEEAKKDWTFDVSQFDLTNGLDIQDLNQVKNFAFSLPGMIVGGLFEGYEKGHEAISGDPIQEYREKAGGGWEVPDYKLDATQRAAAGLDAAINVFGTFTGGSGRAIGGLAKAGIKKASGVAGKEINALKKAGMSEDDIIEDVLAQGEKTKTLVDKYGDLNKAYEKYDKALQKQDLLSGMSKGVVTRALESGRGGKPLGTMAGLAADAGDEAVEEFVQSWADDVRMKNVDENSLDRALTGAAWGAAGGLMMGGGGRLLSHVSDLSKRDESPDRSEYSVMPTNEDISDLRAITLDNLGSARFNDAAKEAQLDAEKAATRVPGSTSVVQTKPSREYKWNQCGLGDEEIRSIFLSQGVDENSYSADIIAESFGTTKEEFLKAMRTENDFAAYLNKLIEAKGGVVRVCVGRNPDTRFGGFYMNLTKVWNGKGFSCRPEVMQAVGSDWDSDRGSVFFDPHSRLETEADPNIGTPLRPIGYATQLLFHNEKGVSNIDWILGGIGKNTHAVSSDIKAILEKYMPAKEAKEVSDKLSEAISLEDEDKRNNQISFILSQLRDKKEKEWQDAQKNGDNTVRSGDNILQDILSDLLDGDRLLVINTARGSFSAAKKNWEKLIGLNDETDSESSESFNSDPKVAEYQEYMHDIEAHGTSGGQISMASLADQIGLISFIANVDSKGNPVFRQFGGLRYWINSVEMVGEAISVLGEQYNADGLIQNLIRHSFKISNPGDNPSMAIEGLCDDMFITQIFDHLKIPQNRMNENNVGVFVKNIIEIQSALARMYNIAQAQMTSQNWDVPYDSAYKSPLDGRERKLENDESLPPIRELEYQYDGTTDPAQLDSQFYRQAARLFRNVELGNLLDPATVKLLAVSEHLTLEEFCRDIYGSLAAPNIEGALKNLKASNPTLTRFLEGIVRSYGSEMKAVRASLEQEAKEMKLPGFTQRYRANNNKVDSKDLPAVLKLFDWLYELIGADEALKIGLIYSDGFFDTRIGQEIIRGLEGDSDALLNVVSKLCLYGQYMDVVTRLNSKNEQIKADAKRKIADLAFVSPLHEIISQALLSGDSRAFEWATSFSLSAEESVNELKIIYPFDKEADFVVNALQTETGMFALSSVSSKLRQARSIRAEMARASYDSQISEVQTFEENLKKIGPYRPGSVISFIQDMTYGFEIGMSKDLAVMNVISALRLENSMVEKATIPAVLSAMYSEEEISVAGGIKSLQRRILQYTESVETKSQWQQNRFHILRCFTDPTYRCWVFDEDQGKSVLMTQEVMFREAILDYDPNVPLNDDQMLRVLKAFPQIAGYLCDPFSRVVSKRGQMSVSLARSQSLTEAYRNWMEPKTTTGKEARSSDSEIDYEINRALSNVRMFCSRHLETQKLLVAHLAEKAQSFNGQVDIEALIKEADSFMDLLAEDLLYEVNMETEEEAEKRLEERNARALAEEIWNLLSLAARQNYDETADAAKKAAVSKLTTNLFESLILKNISYVEGMPTLSSSRSFGIDELENLFKDFAENWKDIMKAVAFVYNDSLSGELNLLSETAKNFLDRSTLVTSIVDSLNQAKENGEIADDVDVSQWADQAVSNFLDGDSVFDGFMDSVSSVFEYDKTFVKSDEVVNSMSLNSNDFRSLVNKVKEGREVSTKDAEAEIRGDLEAISKGKKSFDDVARTINNRILTRILYRVSQETDLRINQNAAQLRDDVNKARKDLVKKLRAQQQRYKDHPQESRKGLFLMDKEQLVAGLAARRGNEPENYKPPVLSYSFTDPTAQTVYSIISVQGPASGNETKVGVAGLDQATIVPLDFIPQHMADTKDRKYAFTRSMTVSEVRDELIGEPDMLSVLGQLPTEKQGEYRIVQVNNQEFVDYINSLEDTDVVQIYHPDENAHGLPTYNMLMAIGGDMNGRYHRLSSIYQYLVQHCMEDLVLKYKKRMDPNGDIGEEDALFNEAQRSAGLAMISGNPSFSQMREHFRKYREGFMSFVEDEFTKENGVLNKSKYGKDQARLIVQSVTPGMLVDVEYTYSTKDEKGEVTNKKIQTKRFLDASLFMGDENKITTDNYNNAITGITASLNEEYGVQNGSARITGGEVYICNLDELNYRIMTAVNRSKGSDKIDVQMSEIAAGETLSDWSDHWKNCDGDPGEILHGIKPISWTLGYESIPMTASPTAEQIAQGILSEETSGISADEFPAYSGKGRVRLVYPPAIGTDARRHITSIGANLFGVGDETLVYKIFMGQEAESQAFSAKNTSPYSGAMQRLAKAKGSTDIYVKNNYTNGHGVVWDLSSLDAAVKWSMKYGNRLIVREEVLEKSSYSHMVQRGDPLYIDQDSSVSNGEPVKFIIIDPQQEKQAMAMRGSIPAASVRHVRPEEYIDMTIVYDPESDWGTRYKALFGGISDGSGLVLGYRKDRAVPTKPRTNNVLLSGIIPDRFRSTSQCKFITREEARALLKQVAYEENGKWWPRKTKDGKTDISSWTNPERDPSLNVVVLDSPYAENEKRNGHMGSGYYDEMLKIIDYLVTYIDGKDDTGRLDPKDIKKSCVIGLISNGNCISPFFAPSTLPTNIFGYDMYIKNGVASFAYSGMTTPFKNEASGAKTELQAPFIPNKCMASAAPVRHNPDKSTSEYDVMLDCLSDSKKKHHAGYATHTATESSRVIEMDAPLLSDALYFRMILEGDMNLFYDCHYNERTGAKTYTLKEGIQNWKETYPELYNRFVTNRMRSEDWKLIEEGLATIFDPSDTKRNKLIANVIRTIRRYSHMDPRKALGGFWCEEQSDGNGNTILVKHSYASASRGNGFAPIVDHRTVLHNYVTQKEDLLLLFNSIDSRLCPESSDSYEEEIAANPEAKWKYLIDPYGQSIVSFDDDPDTHYKATIRYGQVRNMGVVEDELPSPGTAANSLQHVGARASEIGFDEETVSQGYRYANMSSGHYSEAYREFLDKADRKVRKEVPVLSAEPSEDIALAARLPYMTPTGLKLWRVVSKLDNDTFGRQRKVWYNNEPHPISDVLADPEEKTQLEETYKFFNRTGDTGRTDFNVSYGIIDDLYKCHKGTTFTDGTDENSKEWTLSSTEWQNYATEIGDNVRSRGLFVVVTENKHADVEGRYSRPLLPKFLAKILWASNSRGIRTYWQDKGGWSAWVDAMKEEQRKADKAYEEVVINKDGGSSKFTALRNMSQAAWLSWDEVSSLTPLAYSADWNTTEMSLQILSRMLASSEGWDEAARERFIELAHASNEKLRAINDRLGRINVRQMKYSQNDDEHVITYSRIDEAKTLTNILNNAAELSKVMALLNPMVTASNLLDRTKSQGMMRFSIWLGNKFRLGPYKAKKEHIVSKQIRDMAVETPQGIAFYGAFRDMEYKGEDLVFLANLIDSGRIDEAIAFASAKAEGNTAQKAWGAIRDFSYNMASGGRKFIKGQMKLIIDRFVMFVEENEVESAYWFREVEREIDNSGEMKKMTYLEYLLQTEGFEGLMKECLKVNSISYSSFMKAMNSAKRGDMAQKNAVGMIIADVCKKMPLSNFVMTTMVSRFPMYGLNVTGRALNYILPMSSINYAFTELLGKTKYGKELGIEESQIHASMREALLADLCRFGVTGVALILVSISGAIQPPDDEKKWGNIDEWTVLGTRVGESWWIEDTMSMVLPLACFWKACDSGQPRLDILMNGLSDLCYSNPVVRCGDVAAWLMNPAESILASYEEDYQQFQNAKGGAPDLGQWMQANAYNVGMNWLAQFFTPSILRDWYRSSEALEKSYKRGWKKSASGAIGQEGQEGATEYYTYDEAMKHKLTQRNPVLAWLYSTFTGDDSYLLQNMPNTVMYDDYQLAATHGSSVSGLEGEERIAKVADIIAMLQGVDDIDSFVEKTGFHLDYETLMAVSSQVWDLYHAADAWYNELQSAGKLDYTVLGNGDWNEGKKIAAELKQYRDQTKQYWYNFYYQKLKDTAIGRQIVLYNRYNTTYATDVNGDVYATGIRRSPLDILPWTTAPGTMTNPEGTAGYENDFASISAVTGLPLDSRALIPAESGLFDLPDFEELSADKNGNSYSSQHNDIYGMSSSSTGASYSSYRSSGGSGGGGGGGGYRSSAGGFYAPSVNLPRANSSRIMNTDRAIKPNYDYLRPDFETKGSREAYRRSDI